MLARTGPLQRVEMRSNERLYPIDSANQMSLMIRFSLWGAVLLAAVFVMGLGYRYLFIAPDLSFSPRILVMMLMGSVPMGMGVALLRTR